MEFFLQRKLICITFALVISGCSVGPEYVQPEIDIPNGWKNETDRQCDLEVDEEGSLVYLDNWWLVFEDEQLNDLEELAVQNNRNLYIAYERVNEARALVGIAAADLYPQATLNPQTTNTVELIKTFTNPNPNPPVNCCPPNPNNIFRIHEVFYYLPLNLSYEVDLWGKIRERWKSAKYNWQAQEKDYQVVMLRLTSDLAVAYFQLRAIDKQIDLLTTTIAARQKAYDINKDRYESQITLYSAVTLAAQELESVKTQYFEAVRQREVLEDEIAVLLGVNATDFCLDHLPLEDLPPCIPPSLPSEVLLRRPDIAEAELRARSENALVKSAYAQFLPSLTLTATVGYESPVLREFTKWLSRYWSDGLQSNQVIFDGGRTNALVLREIARFRQASGFYQQQVLIAFQEVEDALADLESYAKQYATADSTVKWAEKTYTIYYDRYRAGVTDYINVTTAENDLLNYQINLNTIQGLRFIATVQFIKSLGGGW